MRMTHLLTIGIDISKAHLDVFRLSDEQYARFDNTQDGHKALLAWLGKPENVDCIVYEPTGRYHRAIETLLSRQAYPLVRVNPLQARRFAQAMGVRAKTDKVDARMLASMGRALPKDERAIPSEKHNELKELQIARQALIKDRTAARNRGYGLSLKLLKRQNIKRLKQIQKDIEAIEAAMKDIMADDPKLNRHLDILCSIPGISTISAQAILVEMPEIGTLSPAAVTSLAGLAPFARESGQYKGKRFIYGGRKYLREALYMPALVASRYNPDMKHFYKRLTGKGKPGKLALTAVMRKLIILANALIKQDRMWTEIRP